MENRPGLIGLVLFGLLFHFSYADDSVTFGNNTARTNSTGETFAPSIGAQLLDNAWGPYTLPAVSYSQPVVVGKRVYVGCENGELRCVTGGTLTWSYTADGSIHNSPTYSGGYLYFNTRSGSTYCVHALTGAFKWKYVHHGDSLSSPMVVSGRVFVCPGAPSTEFLCLDALTGALVWRVDIGQISHTSPLAVNGKVVAGSNSGKWYLYDVNGTRLAMYDTTTPPGYNSAGFDGTYIYLPGSDFNRNVCVVDASLNFKKKVYFKPPGFSKASGGAVSTSGSGIPLEAGKSLVDEDTYVEIVPLAKPERDAKISELESQMGADLSLLRKYLDAIHGDSPASLFLAAGDTVIDTSRPIISSSPAAYGGKASLIHRQLEVDSSTTYVIGRLVGNEAVPENSSMEFGITPPPYAKFPIEYFAPAMQISAGKYMYIPAATTSGSTVTHKILIYDYQTGASLGSFALDGYVTAAPTVANGNLYVITSAGTLYALKGGNTAPTVPSSMTPANDANITTTNTPTITWTGQVDAEGDAISTILEYGVGPAAADIETFDGKVSSTFATGINSYTFAAQPSGTIIYFRIRSVDSNSAMSDWTETRHFYVNKDTFPPLPPTDVSAIAYDSKVLLKWTQSTSSDLLYYRVYYKLQAQQWTDATQIEGVTGTFYWITGLQNGQTYDIMILAVDNSGNTSTSVVVSATPQPAITFNGNAYLSIQSAIDAAQAAGGGTVNIGPGTFVENLTLANGVSLVGSSPALTKIKAAFTTIPTIVVNGSSELARLNVTGGSKGIQVNSGALVNIHNNVIEGNTGDGVVFDAGSAGSFLSNTSVYNGGSGVLCNSSDIVMKNEVVAFNTGWGLFSSAGAGVEYSVGYQNGAGDINMTGKGVFVGKVVFTPDSVTDSTYIDASDSASVDAADPKDDFSQEPAPNGGRLNAGAYGNTAYAATTPNLVSVPEASTGAGGGGGACFIATAAFSVSNSPGCVETTDFQRIQTLKKFRDEVLKSTSVGSTFSSAYGSTAAPVAHFVMSSPVKGIASFAIREISGAFSLVAVIAVFALLAFLYRFLHR